MEIRFGGRYFGFEVDALTVVDNTTKGVPTVDDNFSVTSYRTADLPYNATATQVLAALEGLPSIAVTENGVTRVVPLIEPGDIAVTGGRLSWLPVDIEFRGKYAGADIKGMTIENDGSNPVSDGPNTLVPVLTDDRSPVVYSVRHRLEELINVSNPERGEITADHIPPDILVRGGPLPAAPVTIEFVGQYTGQDVFLLETDPAAAPRRDDSATSTLTQGTAPNAWTVQTSVSSSSAVTARLAARLAIDPGIVVKLQSARIEAERGRRSSSPKAPRTVPSFSRRRTTIASAPAALSIPPITGLPPCRRPGSGVGWSLTRIRRPVSTTR